jgi:hypothetical protein
VQSLDDRLRALAEALEDPEAASKATIERRAAQLRRRRRLVLASGAAAATVAVVVGAVAGFDRNDDRGIVTTDNGPSTTEATTLPTQPETTTSVSTTVPTTATSTTTPGSDPGSDSGADTGADRGSDPATVPGADSPEEGPGDLASATTAIRSACRRFYGYDVADLDPAPGEDTSGTTLLAEPALVARCDDPPVEFRGDCYAQRPATFVAGEGGCAVLGGYLAVYYGDHPAGTWDGVDDPMYRFTVGDDTWWIYPESD